MPKITEDGEGAGRGCTSQGAHHLYGERDGESFGGHISVIYTPSGLLSGASGCPGFAPSSPLAFGCRHAHKP